MGHGAASLGGAPAHAGQRLPIAQYAQLADGTVLAGRATQNAVLLAARRPGGAFGEPVADERAVAPQVAIATNGAMRVAYRSTPPGNDRGPRSGRPKLATTGDEGPETVVTAGRQPALAYELRAGGRGEVTLAWQRAEPGLFSRGAVFARAVTASGRLGVRQLLTVPGEDGSSPTLAVGPRGDALVAWMADDERLRARIPPPSG